MEGGKPESPEENPWSEVTVNNKLNPHTLSGRNRTRKQHSWETSALTTALSLLAILNKNGVLQHGYVPFRFFSYFNALFYPVRLPEISEAEKQLIQGTADFFALNMYSAFLVEHREFPADVEWNYLSDQQMKTTFHKSWRRGISMGPFLFNYYRRDYEPKRYCVPYTQRTTLLNGYEL